MGDKFAIGAIGSHNANNTDKVDLDKLRERYDERQSTNAHLAANSVWVQAQQAQC